MKYGGQGETQLLTKLLDPDLADDPAAFVEAVYPWGEPNTPLERYSGPRAWQRDVLNDIAAHIKAQQKKQALDLDPVIFRSAVASGRGIGKSALVSWLAHWMMSTRLGSTTIISANNEPQLRTVTFPEIRKWFSMAVNSHWFELTAMAVHPAEWFAKQIQEQRKIDPGYYYVQGKLWTEESPNAFAGPHSMVGMQLIFDEAAGIPSSIWDVAGGYFTDLTPDRYWLAFSNPRNNVGGFYDRFHNEKVMPLWKRRQIDSRTVEGSDKSYYEDIIAQYGIDNDVARIEVLGQFPKQGANQFISNEAVHGAQKREVIEDAGAPLLLGVDIARFGDDANVARFRQGPDARSIPAVKWKGMDTVATAERVAGLIDKFRPDGVCIDAGQGTGVIDILRRRGYRVEEVWFGAKAESHEWANRRTEMYARLREWLPGGCIDSDPLLFGDLTAPSYDFFGKAKDQIMLESKDALKQKIQRSPDDGDALALTFAKKFSRRDTRASRYSSRARQASGLDYNLFSP